jgi:hypothetical protein
VSAGLTPSERFVTALCERAFLKLWTHANPLGKKGKELCDCLIVCGQHIVIVSVKDVTYRDTGDQTGFDRWQRAAIEAPARQIAGAERWLNSVSQFDRRDGRSVTLPPSVERKIHRIAVSLGSRGEAPLRWGDFGHGFVHVFDELSLTAAFGELDTITDFIDYLSATESLFARGVRVVFDGSGPEDLLALYVVRGATFGLPDNADQEPPVVLLPAGLWKDFLSSPGHKARVDDRQSSYFWDRLIDDFANDLLTDGMFDMYSKEVTKDELGLVAMALQPRGHRANLSDALLGLLDSKKVDVRARIATGANATTFVFLAGKTIDREHRMMELALRCFVARGLVASTTTVVGIATDRPGSSDVGYSSDIVYMHVPDWTAEDRARAEGIRRELGYFQNAAWSASS